MKKLSLTLALSLMITLFVSSVAFGEMAEIKVGEGTLKIGGVLQAGYTHYIGDDIPADAAVQYNSFTLNRARLLLSGEIIPEKIKYFVQTEFKGETSIKDFKARFFYLPMTEVTVGRFSPAFTIKMTTSTASQGLINYPLTTQKFGMWRQMGIQTTTTTEYLDVNLGLFNGADQPDNTMDNNNSKDFSARVNFKPLDKLNFGGYAWIGKALPTMNELSWPDETLKNNMFGFFMEYERDFSGVIVRDKAELITGTKESVDEFVYIEPYAGPIPAGRIRETKSLAFWGETYVRVSKKVELLGRVDYYDPDTDVDGFAEAWYTFGVNHYFADDYAMIYLNYIAKVEKSGYSTDNDLLQAQIQISF